MKKKRRRRKRTFTKEPTNLSFWLSTIKNEEDLNQFLLRGDEKQKQSIIQVLNYLKRLDPQEFRVLNGHSWLEKFMESFNET